MGKNPIVPGRDPGIFGSGGCAGTGHRVFRAVFDQHPVVLVNLGRIDKSLLYRHLIGFAKFGPVEFQFVADGADDGPPSLTINLGLRAGGRSVGGLGSTAGDG